MADAICLRNFIDESRSQMMNTTNIFQNIPQDLAKDLAKEITEVIAENERVRIERIISRGHNSPRQCDQPQDEFILLVAGEARITQPFTTDFYPSSGGSFTGLRRAGAG